MCLHVYLISLHMQILYEYHYSEKFCIKIITLFIITHENLAKWVSLYKGTWLGIHESLIIRIVRRSGEAWRCTAETFGLLQYWHCWSYIMAFWLTVRWSHGKGRNEKGPAGHHAPADCKVNSGTWRKQRRRRDFCLREGPCQPEAPTNTGKIKVNISVFCKVQLLIWYVCTNYLYSHCQAHKFKNCYLLTKIIE